MRILFIRHGDPDYVNDTLTEKGHREAALLSELAPALEMGECYVSPLGRAKDTAAYSLKKLGKTAETLDWLQEFPARLDINLSEELKHAFPDAEKEGERYIKRIVWDMAPAYWMEHKEYFDRDAWRSSDAAKYSDMIPLYDSVVAEFDALLKKYGYVREGMYYRTQSASTQTITFFCHFGITCVLLSHLWNVSPFILWHGLMLAPSSVTEVVTEEREQGSVCFRALRAGDISHLYLGNEKASFAGRFREVYANPEQWN